MINGCEIHIDYEQLYLKTPETLETIPEMPKYDILPSGVYWIRHMDAPARLVRDGKVLGAMYE